MLRATTSATAAAIAASRRRYVRTAPAGMADRPASAIVGRLGREARFLEFLCPLQAELERLRLQHAEAKRQAQEHKQDAAAARAAAAAEADKLRIALEARLALEAQAKLTQRADAPGDAPPAAKLPKAAKAVKAARAAPAAQSDEEPGFSTGDEVDVRQPDGSWLQVRSAAGAGFLRCGVLGDPFPSLRASSVLLLTQLRRENMRVQHGYTLARIYMTYIGSVAHPQRTPVAGDSGETDLWPRLCCPARPAGGVFLTMLQRRATPGGTLSGR